MMRGVEDAGVVASSMPQVRIAQRELWNTFRSPAFPQPSANNIVSLKPTACLLLTELTIELLHYIRPGLEPKSPSVQALHARPPLSLGLT